MKRKRRAGLGVGTDDKPIGTCWCTRNPRTKRGVKVCVVPKSKLHPNGRKLGGNC